MKKIVINSTSDVEELYQIFKKKMIKNYEEGKSASEGGKEMTKWLMKKTGLNEPTANAYLVEFADVLMQDANLNPKEWEHGQ